MNPHEEQDFLDLAIKVIAKRATEQEVQEFNALLEHNADHRQRFETFKTDVIVAKDIMTLVSATEAKGPGLTPAQFSQLEKKLKDISKQHNRRKWLIGLVIVALLVITVVIISRTSSIRTETLNSDDISTPDGIIITTINTLNNK